MTHKVYIGIGSNLDSPRDNCERAINMIRDHPDCSLTASSSLYKTEPVGMSNQSWFINAAIAIDTHLEPLNLLNALLSIEQDMGRIRMEKWGPRIIDLDILFYGNKILKLPQLEIPHPEISNRRFVLAPLEEIAGDYNHPKINKSISTMLRELDDHSEVSIIAPSN